MKTTLSVTMVLLAAVLCGCGGGAGTGPALTWVDVLEGLTNADHMARLDVPGTSILTSFDPTGGNDDFNHFVRKGPEGWVVLADLKGPGCLTRFWFTGAEKGSLQHVRFYFDNEKEPRLDLTLDDLTGGREPFKPPLTGADNYCWYSQVPMTYARRLVVMTQEGGYKPNGWPRLFYQINSFTLPKGRRAESFTGDVSAADAARVAAVREAWARGGMPADPPGAQAARETVTVPAGGRAAAKDLPGPAIIRRLSITPGFGALATQTEREALLRQAVVQISWDNSSAPSVEVPLGDLFGSLWRRTRYESMFFGLTNDTFVTRFPMPFQSSARITIVNDGPKDVSFDVETVTEPLAAWDADWGYFHSTWSRTTPDDVGRPHPILRAEGRGKYVGCLLGVVSLDKSWWILEGDEKMYVDGQTTPYWRGTGLEDYFNGGWYYQNPLVRPLHGLTFKAFFRIGQYRLHLADPVVFPKSFDMTFERGPEQASHGWMESVAWYYLDKPARAAFALKPAPDRAPPADPLAEATIMTELFNAERMGDYRGAADLVDLYLETRPQFPFAPLLRLRKIAYLEREKGFETAKPLYEQFIASETHPAALEQAKLLLWFHGDPNRAILTLYSNARSTGFVDGVGVCAVDRPDRIAFSGVTLGPGAHVMASESAQSNPPYPSWVQLCLRTHNRLIGSQTDWPYQFNPQGEWGKAGFDDSGWPTMGRTGTKGPPEEPYIWVEPNAFVDMQSLARGLRPADEEWPDKRSRVVYRKTIQLP